MQRSSVVLPEPEGPTMATTSPRATSIETPAQHLERAEALVQVDDPHERRRRVLAGGSRPGVRPGLDRMHSTVVRTS